METFKRIELVIDPEDELTGVKTISLVEHPAIESNFVALAKSGLLPSKKIMAHLLTWAQHHTGAERFRALKELSAMVFPSDIRAQRLLTHKLADAIGL